MKRNIHLAPCWPLYTGGYTNIARCSNCGATGQDPYSMNRHDPCFNCGGEVVDIGAGRWIRTSPWWQIWFPEGYWEPPSSMT